MRRWASERGGAAALCAGLLALVLATGCVSPPPREMAAPGDGLVVERGPDPRSTTVRIRASSCAGMGTGSGFLLDPTTIVTNRHVVEGASELEIETYLGQNLTVTVASQSTFADLAVVRIGGGLDGSAELAPTDPAAGELLRVYGYPGGGPMRVTEGRVRDYVVDADMGTEGRIMRADVEIRPGNSGGPALDSSGRVVGVVYAIELDTKLGLIVPVSTLEKVLGDEAAQQPVQGC